MSLSKIALKDRLSLSKIALKDRLSLSKDRPVPLKDRRGIGRPPAPDLSAQDFWGYPRALQSLTKEVVGTRVLLTRSLFVCDIPRRLPGRVSLATPTSAPLRS